MYPNSSSLKTGNVLLCHTKYSLEAFAIRQVLGSNWNHAVFVAVIADQVFIVEAKGGTTLQRTPYADWCKQLPREVKLLSGSCDLAQVLAYEGLPYDYWSCVNHVWRKLFNKWFGRRAGAGAKRLYCFEFIALVYQIPNWWEATPQSIEAYLTAKPA
ncbi:YiiX/YebB-like N1pC/P60 family cysteine hydrolase [Adhaeribacter pallidiroseus]|uniref:Uncharacterized protein n=1 Tax=Adhaeribacter pallidiroseus TaxID=2072847 RepID=A0A369QJ82_9BACT|nr:YiiX/YebB-like N1pC/P60 family cysteine hydrolase [Adhaeribacter pallidiroseus]RDC63286.1 hypothetical protein AHMF7616_01888 [Adhaeribacter pallidiroseus]